MALPNQRKITEGNQWRAFRRGLLIGEEVTSNPSGDGQMLVNCMMSAFVLAGEYPLNNSENVADTDCKSL